MKKNKLGKLTSNCVALVFTLSGVASAQAYEFYADGDTHLNADMLAVFGLMNSRKRYDGTPGGATWREGFIKYGISADQALSGTGTAYGAFNLVSSATWGDGDAAGNSDGSERTTKIEDAYLGWRSADVFPALGEDGVDFSAGRQVVKLGRGFLINDDGLNLGNGAADGALNRGGAYYLAARHAFDRTAVLHLGGQDGLHGTVLWLKSDNRAQAETELAAGTLDYTGKAGTLGLTWVHGIDVADQWASDFQKQREGMDIYSVRGEGNAGIEYANFAFEYAWEDKEAGSENAWYTEASYTFVDTAWSPKLIYRYTRYSENWDALFTGLNNGFGIWFQGEVAANYAGPFNNNTSINHVGVTATPLENLTVGALYFDFRTVNKSEALDLDARELDLYVDWAVNDHLIISPLVGLYQPKKDVSNGGSQVGGNDVNIYSQLVVVVPF